MEQKIGGRVALGGEGCGATCGSLCIIIYLPYSVKSEIWGVISAQRDGTEIVRALVLGKLETR
jgi:hypothetical protein